MLSLTRDLGEKWKQETKSAACNGLSLAVPRPLKLMIQQFQIIVPSGILNKVRRKEKKHVIINWTSESEKMGFQYLLKSTFNSF